MNISNKLDNTIDNNYYNKILSREKILVTGCAGFVGTNLVKHLLKNTQNLIIGFDDFTLGNKKLVNLNKSRRYKFYNLDINNYKKVKKIINKYNY